MATISLEIPESVTLSEKARVGAAAALTRVNSWARTAWCRLNGGHYKVLYTQPSRLALRCVACGHTSPGWAVGSPRFRRTLAGDPARLRAERVA